jgi:hypothetical protein
VEQITYKDLHRMLERGELSVCVWHRRHTLLAVCELAAKSKGLDPLSRWRLKKFRAALDSIEGNDEIEVTGETFCEVVMHAMEAVTLP